MSGVLDDYESGDEIVVTLVGKVGKGRHGGILDSGSHTFSEFTLRSVDIADHYKVEPPKPRWQDLPRGTVFRFGPSNGGCWGTCAFLRTLGGAIRMDNIDITFDAAELDRTATRRGDLEVLWAPGGDT